MEPKSLQEYQIILSQKLELLRHNSSLTQNELTQEVGINRKTVSCIENGANFSVQNLIKLLITYNRIDHFINSISLPEHFDIKKYKKELKKFNRKQKS